MKYPELLFKLRTRQVDIRSSDEQDNLSTYFIFIL